MLPERQLRLLTAYVDGELSSRQRHHVERLLRRSEEARELLRSLQGDSRQLIELPRVAAPAELSTSVMAALPQVKRQPGPRPRLAARTFPVWTGWVAAAAVLVVVSLGSFVQHLSSQNDDQKRAAKPSQRNPDRPEVPDKAVAKDAPSPRPEQKQTPPQREDPQTPPVHQPKPKPLPPELEPEDTTPRPVDVFADGAREPMQQVERVRLMLPIILNLHKLGSKDEADRLRKQMAGASAVRIELLARNATHGLQRLTRVLESRKVPLVIDPAAQVKLKTPQFRHDYALFAENITAEDLTALLAALGGADRITGGKKPNKPHFDGSLVVKAFSPWDQKELADLLGVDAVKVRPAEPKSSKLDVHKSIREQTASEVDDILSGKRNPRPGTTQPGATILVLPLSGPRIRSAELRKFLEARKPARPGTLQVLLVLRQQPS